MKVKLLFIMLSLTLSNFAFANCGDGGCGRPVGILTQACMGWGGCGGYSATVYTSGCQTSACGEYESRCECTDPNAYSNDCLSPDVYCEAFGNVGGR